MAGRNEEVESVEGSPGLHEIIYLSVIELRIPIKPHSSMKLDLRREFADLYAYLTDRVRNFDPATNDGPGDPGLVRMIEIGFEYSQFAWVVVVFDTRPDAKPDGEWTFHIETNMLERADWLAAGKANMNGPITLVQLDGTETVLPESGELAVPLGKMIKAVLIKAREDGVFAALPKASRCEFGIEHQEGAYGWPMYAARGMENLV